MTNRLELDARSAELHSRLMEALPRALGVTEVPVYDENTGGGVYVCVIDLSGDDEGRGREAWLTREGENTWYLGFYDFATDDEDEGSVVALNFARSLDPSQTMYSADDSYYLALRVADLFRRIGVRVGR